jgi:uncharacterized membrane protein
MHARWRALAVSLRESFWAIPGAMVCAGVLGAIGAVDLDRSGVVPQWLIDSSWLYNGGGTGARTLLGAVASSTIGVAGTVFSITIAALTLAAGQMGPRLLRNFTRDRGNQFTLGAFLGTFSYALMVLRSVRTQEEGIFIPHLSLTVSIVLAFVCVGTLVYFVGHMASRINVDTVIDLVSNDVTCAIQRLTLDAQPAIDPRTAEKVGTVPIRIGRTGYLQALEANALADWALQHDLAIRLLVKPGDFVFPGVAVAMATNNAAGLAEAISRNMALGSSRVSSDDLEFSARQLVEVAVRALSPGINDPHTAIGVLDRLGAALCELAPRFLHRGELLRDGRVVLAVPTTDYDGLVDAMFNMIRQNASDSPAVLIRMLEVFAAICGCERDPLRVATLRRHAGLVLSDAEKTVRNASDLQDVRRRHDAFLHASRAG